MILIISNKDDRTTNDVIDWLRKYKKEYIRISSEDLIKVSSLFIDSDTVHNELLLTIRGQEFKLSDFNKVWYRRGWITIQAYQYKNDSEELEKEVHKQLYTEVNELTKYLISQFEKISLNKPNDLFLNKLKILDECKKFGIWVPSTIVTSRKSDLIIFLNKKEKIISKNYSQGVFINYRGEALNSYTLLVDNKMISDLPDNFFPMMFQEYIKKSFEVRAFYLEGEFYCSAIISQNDQQTTVDFRNYNIEKPNRTPPYKLSNDMEIKLKHLMNSLDLNSGSIDLLVNETGDYIFLEVNPIGQFAQVSKPCNYLLERKVANFLMSN